MKPYRGIACVVLLTSMVVSATGVQFSKAKMQHYRDKVKRMFYHAYDGYMKYAYPYDELMPISCKGTDTWGSFSLSLVDALDTLLVLGNHTEFERASRLILNNVDVDRNVNVSVFETNIRMIGGLLSAHLLSIRSPDTVRGPSWPCDGPLLRLAERFGDKLLPAFNTATGMPYGTVNLRYGVHRQETPITCTACVGTFLLEFATLSRLTGKPIYERVAQQAMQKLFESRSTLNLVGNHINVQNGQWTATDAGIGAGVDSYFEYLVKAAFLFQQPQLMQQFHVYLDAINRYLRQEDWFVWVSMTTAQVSIPVFQSLEAFWPGLLTMLGHIDDATRIMHTYNAVLRQYGMPPEFYNIGNQEAVHKRAGYPLRPELAESLMYLYRATEDPTWLSMAADMVDTIEYSTRTKCGYATVENVRDHVIEDRCVDNTIASHTAQQLRMESFFLSETTKYLYLIFDPDNFVHNSGESAQVINTTSGFCTVQGGGYIFNTEAHLLDPGAIYCCSEQHAHDTHVLNDFASNIDLVELIGLRETRAHASHDTLTDPPDQLVVNIAPPIAESIEIAFETTNGETGAILVQPPVSSAARVSGVASEHQQLFGLTPPPLPTNKVDKAATVQLAKELTDNMMAAMQKMLADFNGLVGSTTNLDAMRQQLYRVGAKKADVAPPVEYDDDGHTCNRNELRRLLSIVYGRARAHASTTAPLCATDEQAREYEAYVNEIPVLAPADGTPPPPRITLAGDYDDAWRTYTSMQQLNELLACKAQPFLQRFTGLGLVMH